MFELAKIRTPIKIFFHLLQVGIILSGSLSLFFVYLLFTREGSLIPVSPNLLFKITSISILSVVSGYLGLNCLNSERKTKIFLFIISICALMNLQILMAIESNRILDTKVEWMNERWSALSSAQKIYVQEKFKCCGLETVEDRAAGKCSYNVPCASIFSNILRTIRNVSQQALVSMFFIETLALSMLGFLKFIKY